MGTTVSGAGRLQGNYAGRGVVWPTWVCCADCSAAANAIVSCSACICDCWPWMLRNTSVAAAGGKKSPGDAAQGSRLDGCSSDGGGGGSDGDGDGRGIGTSAGGCGRAGFCAGAFDTRLAAPTSEPSLVLLSRSITGTAAAGAAVAGGAAPPSPAASCGAAVAGGASTLSVTWGRHGEGICTKRSVSSLRGTRILSGAAARVAVLPAAGICRDRAVRNRSPASTPPY